MDTADGRSRLFAILEESLCRDADLEFAIVFGSHATDEVHKSSDFDLAVKFVDDLSSHERFRKRCFLSGNLQREDAPFVDVSDIDELPLTVAHEAVNGAFLCGNELAFNRFKETVETAFAKRRTDDERRHRATIDRIAEGGLSG